MNTPSQAAAEVKYAVIVVRAYGVTDVYAATMENAMTFFNQNVSNLPQQVLDIAAAYDNRDGVKFASATILSKALQEVLSLDAGSNSPRLQAMFYGRAPKEGPDERPQVVIQPEWKGELALYLVNNNLTTQTLPKYDALSLFEKGGVENALSFLAPFAARYPNGVQWVGYDDYFDAAEEYRIIANRRWKPEAPERAIVKRICEFINERLGGRGNFTIEVCEIHPTAS